MADEKQPLQADDWLAELEQEGESGGFDNLDQSDIDQLLSGSDTAGVPEQHQTGMEGTGEGSVELDQDALDALLAASDEGGGAGGAPSPAAGGAPAAPLQDESLVDQNSLEALLGSDNDDFQAALADDSNVPSQSDIDELFAKAQDDDDQTGSRPEDDFDLDELFGGNGDFRGNEGPAGLEPKKAPVSRSAADSRNRNDPGPEEDIFAEEITTDPQPAEGRPRWHVLAGSLGRLRAYRPAMGGMLAAVLLLGSGIYWLATRVPDPVTDFTAGQESSSLTGSESSSIHEQDQPSNSPPTARGAEYQMPHSGGEVPLLLYAQDKEGDGLSYEITVQPAHGRLTGKLPTPIYIPNNNFPGSDLLEFKVFDGMVYSEPAVIRITGPDLRRIADKKEPDASRLITPKQSILRSIDVTLKTVSTRELIIDWRKIWRQANQQPMSGEIAVEVAAGDLRGSLQKIDQFRHRYIPDRLFSGSENIGYRFRAGAASSKLAELQLLVDLGDFPPEIRMRGLEEKKFQVGDTVVLDASTTNDDDPGTLRFEWQQLAGTPVRLEQLNMEGSMVSFVVPSSFYTEEDPGPVLRLTVTDRSGQSNEKTMKISTRSRRHSALWLGNAPEGSGGLLRPVASGVNGVR